MMGIKEIRRWEFASNARYGMIPYEEALQYPLVDYPYPSPSHLYRRRHISRLELDTSGLCMYEISRDDVHF